jgi:hypothetical protein
MPQPIAEFSRLDPEAIRRDVLSRYRPAILRGLVDHWPAVQRARESTAAIASYLAGLDSGRDVDAVLTPPDANGRIFYNADLSGFNFLRNRLPLTRVIEQALRYGAFESAPAVAVQSSLIDECLPGFAAANRLPLLADSVRPRIWLGTAITTPAHFDESDNIACVVAGRRRFTLFPPEQVANLYVGPLDHTPTATPISLVDFAAPDLAQHSRFAQALEHAEVGVLEPGDAIFIPTLWWHHVESLAKFNMLVNYWWNGSIGSAASGQRADSGIESLLHGLLSLRPLPPEQRAAWRALFDHYVFALGADPADHLPPDRRGVLGEMTPELAQSLRAFLAKRLQR